MFDGLKKWWKEFVQPKPPPVYKCRVCSAVLQDDDIYICEKCRLKTWEMERKAAEDIRKREEEERVRQNTLDLLIDRTPELLKLREEIKIRKDSE